MLISDPISLILVCIYSCRVAGNDNVLRAVREPNYLPIVCTVATSAKYSYSIDK